MNKVEWPRSTVNHSQYGAIAADRRCSIAVLFAVGLRGFERGTVYVRKVVRPTDPAPERASWMCMGCLLIE